MCSFEMDNEKQKKKKHKDVKLISGKISESVELVYLMDLDFELNDWMDLIVMNWRRELKTISALNNKIDNITQT